MVINPLSKLREQLSDTEAEEFRKIDEAEYRKIDELAPGPEWNWLQPAPLQAATAGLVSIAPDGLRHQVSTLRTIEADHSQETTKRQEISEDPAAKAELDRERLFRELVELYAKLGGDDLTDAADDFLPKSAVTEVESSDGHSESQDWRTEG